MTLTRGLARRLGMATRGESKKQRWPCWRKDKLGRQLHSFSRTCAARTGLAETERILKMNAAARHGAAIWRGVSSQCSNTLSGNMRNVLATKIELAEATVSVGGRPGGIAGALATVVVPVAL